MPEKKVKIALDANNVCAHFLIGFLHDSGKNEVGFRQG